ncbi:hypothetical protein [Thalassobius sp. Cn5-15]|jgi:hypothetical protein|uniref:hypothetical protein n=1 Tax=Thalassobius sp. Cn5-15 TaxID=2917763 RepID=UPI001EF31F43|nr:hypothetical protein [Thalassobius sp. Cn5-15]MCG7493003.1 hypothetical protein [Thalassobius sp. Cn5-15]
MRRATPLYCLSLFVIVTACAPAGIPDQAVPAAQNAPYPELVPLETVLAGQATADLSTETSDKLRARAAALRARAARLRAQNGG